MRHCSSPSEVANCCDHMKDTIEITESSADVQQKRKKKRGGTKFSGSKQRKRTAMRRKEMGTRAEEGETHHASGVHGDIGRTPFQIRCRERATNLDSVSEMEEYDQLEQDCENLLDEAFGTATKHCTSQTDSHQIENEDEERGVDSRQLVCLHLQ